MENTEYSSTFKLLRSWYACVFSFAGICMFHMGQKLTAFIERFGWAMYLS